MTVINEKQIFVFGSNLSGIHGAGAAKTAMEHHGAIYGKGEGHYGNTYALPSKGKNITFMSLDEIEKHVRQFVAYAEEKPELTFIVTQIACGLAGFKASEIAPLFANAPANCLFDEAWKPHLPELFKYWGTF